MTRHRGEPGRCYTSALAAVGAAAELAWRNPGLEVRRDTRRGPCEHALGRRFRRYREHVDQPLRREEFRIAQPQRSQVADDALPVGRREPLVGDLSDLGCVKAGPDLGDFRPRGPESQELIEVSRCADLLPRYRAVNRDLVTDD